MEQTDYTIVKGTRMFMLSELIDKVKKKQKKGWVCQGGIVIDPHSQGESCCYQAMVKEKYHA